MAAEKKLNALDDRLLEAIAGGVLGEMDEGFFLVLINGCQEERSVNK